MNKHANDMVKLWSGCIEFDKRMITSLSEQLKTQKKQLELNKKRLAEAVKYKELHNNSAAKSSNR